MTDKSNFLYTMIDRQLANWLGCHAHPMALSLSIWWWPMATRLVVFSGNGSVTNTPTENRFTIRPISRCTIYDLANDPRQTRNQCNSVDDAATKATLFETLTQLLIGQMDESPPLSRLA